MQICNLLGYTITAVFKIRNPRSHHAPLPFVQVPPVPPHAHPPPLRRYSASHASASRIRSTPGLIRSSRGSRSIFTGSWGAFLGPHAPGQVPRHHARGGFLRSQSNPGVDFSSSGPAPRLVNSGTARVCAARSAMDDQPPWHNVQPWRSRRGIQSGLAFGLAHVHPGVRLVDRGAFGHGLGADDHH